MKGYFRYLARHRCTLLGAALCALIFLVTFYLYDINPMAVVYPTIVCAMVLLIISARGYLLEKQKCQLLKEIAKQSAAMINELPAPSGAVEEAYQDVIYSLKHEVAELDYIETMKYKDMVDYYTAWAHQIKTPIAAMSLTLQSEDSALARKLRGQLFRIEQYVEMVMTFLRLGSSQTDYVFKSHNLDAILKPCLRKFSTEFIERKLYPKYEIGANNEDEANGKEVNLEFLTDDKWFAFVVEQVLSNALKYTREGGIKVYLTGDASKSESASKSETTKSVQATLLRPARTLCIEDTGIGIAEADLPRIFEKGYTGFNGRSDKRASGIGLYLCKTICDNLSHKIWIESEVGAGTRVFISLDRYDLKKE